MPVKKRALGRGLDALLGSDSRTESAPEPVAPSQTGVLKLPVGAIYANPFQPRKHFREEGLEDLSASIREKGILQPLIVRKVGERYELVAGERRWRASQRVGLTEVPVIVREYTDQDMLELALIENLQREELSPIEEAQAYRQLIQAFELTQDQVAERVGKSRVAVTNALRLLALPEPVLNWIEAGELTAGHGRALLSLSTPEGQLALAREVMARQLSVRATEQRSRKLSDKPGKPAPAPVSPSSASLAAGLEEKLSLQLGLKAKIHATSNAAGRIEVFYTSLDDFHRFFEQIGLSLEQDL